jgi:tryptophan halogenase
MFDSFFEEKNILVIGGGTAGWLTSLYAYQALAKFGYKIITVESSEIGILGAGEGTTPVFMSMLDAIDVSPFEVIANCGGTVKSGIRFINWSTKDFFNPFLSNEFCEPDFFYKNDNVFYEKYTDFSFLYGKINNMKNEEFLFSDRISSKNLVPIGNKITNDSRLTQSLYNKFEHFSNWALHFDARKLAQFLKQKGLERGISLIDSKVENVNVDENNFIKSITLKNGQVIDCDFVFDCTGFTRLIIGKHFGTEWKSYSDKLAVNKAIPFFQNESNNLEPFTQSIAMDYGWVWKIPTQERYGCGYVFDSNYVSEEKAAEEVQRKFSYKFDDIKVFNFDAGTFNEVWVKNCMSAGLASNFIEPLEATSIMQLILQLKRFLSDPLNVKCRDQKIINKFNRMYIEDSDEIVDYIQLHYFTNRTDTLFWKEFKQAHSVSDFVEEILSISKFRQPNYDDFDKRNIFKLKSYLPILYGLDLISQNALENTLAATDFSKYIEFSNIIKNHEIFESLSFSHLDFLNIVKEEYNG